MAHDRSTMPEGHDPDDFDLAECADLQAEVELRLLLLVDQLRARIGAIAGELGLTSQQVMLLRRLDQPRTMGEIARTLACDPSNVTGLVARMETRGLLTREADVRDQRIKRLRLTEEGETARAAIQRQLLSESPATAGLNRAERERLLALLRRLTPEPL